MRSSLTRRGVLGGAAASAVVLTTARAHACTPVVHEIAIREFAFEPDMVQVAVGDTIRWSNHDLAPHTATADQLGWDTGEIAKGDTIEITVTEGMETSYFCAFHPHMKGAIEIL